MTQENNMLIVKFKDRIKHQLIHDSMKIAEIHRLGEADGPSPYVEAIAKLREVSNTINQVIARLEELENHQHEWVTTDDGKSSYCNICGANGDV